MNNSVPPSIPSEFTSPPAEPISLIRAWIDQAYKQNVREPGALAMATTDDHGHSFNRIMQVVDIHDTGLVFTTHSGSAKGRHLICNPWASGVLYWRELGRQLIVSGPTQALPDSESEAFWKARPLGTRPMSSVSKQSALLTCEDTLRSQASQLASSDASLPRPSNYQGYLIEAMFVEFWQADPIDRLHLRLRYERSQSTWQVKRLQP